MKISATEKLILLLLFLHYGEWWIIMGKNDILIK